MSQTPQYIDQCAYQLDWRDVAEILYALNARDRGQLITAMDPLHPADIADLLEQINSFDRSRLIRLYDREFDGETLTELQEGLREEIIGLLKLEVLADAVRNLETDDVVDLVENLDDNQQEVILAVLVNVDRVAVESSLNNPADSAGRLMQRELVIAPEDWQVGDAIDHLRAADNLPQQFYHVTLVDGKMHPIANISLGCLMATRCSVALKDIAEETLHVIPSTQAEADAAYAFNQYHLISTPVVGEDGRIVGVITSDDAMVVLDEEHEEDILRLAGVGHGSLSDSVLQTTWQRVPWLAVNLVTAILASIVIAQFEATIESFLALAVLMPIIASMGGNARTQSLTVEMRALAAKDLTASNVWRPIWRQVFAGMNNCILFAVQGGRWANLVQFRNLGLCYRLDHGDQFYHSRSGWNWSTCYFGTLRHRSGLGLKCLCNSVTDVVVLLAFLGLATWVSF